MVAKRGTKSGIAPGTVYGPFTVGQFTGRRTALRQRLYAVTCHCGRQHEKTAAALLNSKILNQKTCRACRTDAAQPLGVDRKKVVERVIRTQSTPVVAVEFGISKQRVHQILRQEGVVRRYELPGSPAPSFSLPLLGVVSAGDSSPPEDR